MDGMKDQDISWPIMCSHSSHSHSLLTNHTAHILCALAILGCSFLSPNLRWCCVLFLQCTCPSASCIC
ncbi:hypothetical protein VULLAG_LOCUS21605 [Vulpes lagopus]